MQWQVFALSLIVLVPQARAQSLDYGIFKAQVEPIYENVEGWHAETACARSWAELPAQAIKYVRRIEELVGCPVALLSTSPEREDTILMHNPFEN